MLQIRTVIPAAFHASNLKKVSLILWNDADCLLFDSFLFSSSSSSKVSWKSRNLVYFVTRVALINRVIVENIFNSKHQPEMFDPIDSVVDTFSYDQMIGFGRLVCKLYRPLYHLYMNWIWRFTGSVNDSALNVATAANHQLCHRQKSFEKAGLHLQQPQLLLLLYILTKLCIHVTKHLERKRSIHDNIQHNWFIKIPSGGQTTLHTISS